MKWRIALSSFFLRLARAFEPHAGQRVYVSPGDAPGTLRGIASAVYAALPIGVDCAVFTEDSVEVALGQIRVIIQVPRP